MFSMISLNSTLQEAFKTTAQINEELKGTEFDGAFCKKILLVHRFFHFLLNVENREKKMIHQKKKRDHRTSKIAKSRQSYCDGHLPCHLFIYFFTTFATNLAILLANLPRSI